MADKELSALTAASALDGSELVHIVQGGNSRKSTTQDIADLGGGGLSPPTSATFGTAIKPTGATDATYTDKTASLLMVPGSNTVGVWAKLTTMPGGDFTATMKVSGYFPGQFATAGFVFRDSVNKFTVFGFSAYNSAYAGYLRNENFSDKDTWASDNLGQWITGGIEYLRAEFTSSNNDIVFSYGPNLTDFNPFVTNTYLGTVDGFGVGVALGASVSAGAYFFEHWGVV